MSDIARMLREWHEASGASGARVLQQFVFEAGLSDVAPQKYNEEDWDEETNGIKWSMDARQIVYNHNTREMKERVKISGKWTPWVPLDAQAYRDEVLGIYKATQTALGRRTIRLYRGVAGAYADKLAPGASVRETTLNSYTAKESVARFFAEKSITRGEGNAAILVQTVPANRVWTFNGTPMPLGARTSEHEDEYTVLGRRGDRVLSRTGRIVQIGAAR